MTKHFNHQYDTTIFSTCRAIHKRNQSPAHGEIVPHKFEVHNVMFYQSIEISGGSLFNQVFIPKEMILSLADQIREIESREFESPYDALPF